MVCGVDDRTRVHTGNLYRQTIWHNSFGAAYLNLHRSCPQLMKTIAEKSDDEDANGGSNKLA